jgi:hypothetical protein
MSQKAAEQIEYLPSFTDNSAQNTSLLLLRIPTFSTRNQMSCWTSTRQASGVWIPIGRSSRGLRVVVYMQKTFGTKTMKTGNCCGSTCTSGLLRGPLRGCAHLAIHLQRGLACWAHCCGSHQSQETHLLFWTGLLVLPWCRPSRSRRRTAWPGKHPQHRLLSSRPQLHPPKHRGDRPANADARR